MQDVLIIKADSFFYLHSIFFIFSYEKNYLPVQYVGVVLVFHPTRPTLHQYDPHVSNRWRSKGKIGASRHANGRRTDGICPLDKIPKT